MMRVATQPLIHAHPDLKYIRYTGGQSASIELYPLEAVLMYDDRASVSRWELDLEEKVLLNRTKIINFYWPKTYSQPALLTVKEPHPDREPMPQLWKPIIRTTEMIMVGAPWVLTDAEIDTVLSTGCVYMIVWNVHQPLMATLLEVEEYPE